MSGRTFFYLFAALITLATVPAHGIVIVRVTITLSPTLESGSDPFGLAGSTWALSFYLNATNYTDSGAAGPRTTTNSGLLKVSGSSGVDGNYTIFQETGSSGFNFYPNFVGSAILAVPDGPRVNGRFSFSGITIRNFNAIGPRNASIMDEAPIQISDYQGLVMSSDISGFGGDSAFTASGTHGGSPFSGTFSFANAPVTAVPEPATYTILAGLIAMGVVWLRRQKRFEP